MLGYACTNSPYRLAGSSDETVETYPRSRRVVAAAGLAITVSLFAVSGAQAQNCGPGLPLPVRGEEGSSNLIGVGTAAIAAAVAATSNITAVNTAFLTQSTVFVSAPPNPQPGQEGGGVWVRGVGGELTLKSSQSIFGTVGGATASGGCNTKFQDTYGGVQVGADVARLNIDGWNFHLGTTAGAIWSSGSIKGGSPVGGLNEAPV